jgi:hypothetical protein
MKRFVVPLVLGGWLLLPASLLAPARAEDPAPQPAAPSAEQILGWVNDLGSDDFRTREQASRSLSGAGEAAREALETAVKTSDSLEVRWRAQQLLMRLDGKAERSIGEEQKPRAGAGGSGGRVFPGGGPVGPMDDKLRELLETDDPAKLRELIEKMVKESLGGGPWSSPNSPFGDSPFGTAPFGGWGDLTFGMRIQAGDLTLKRGMLGMGPWVLEVKSRDAAGVTTTKSYSGESLDEILAANPDLKDHPSIGDLKAKLETAMKREQPFLPPGLTWRERLGESRPGFTFKSSQGIEIRQDASGAVVKIHGVGPDGKPQVKEYRGASLEAIQREHPEVAEKLGGGFHLRVGPPRFFRGPREEPLAPVTPPEGQPGPAPAGPVFGVFLAEVEPVLAAHLKLEAGRGALIADVRPDSQASRLGLQVHDVIESIDGAAVTRDEAVERLRTAARTESPLTLGIVRDGARLTLSR